MTSADGDDQAPRVPAGWTLAEERRLGDHIQRAIRKQPPPEVAAEDRDAERIMREAIEGWPGYGTGDDA